MKEEGKYLDDIANLAREDNVKKYRDSSDYSFSPKNRVIYWGTSLLMVIFSLSLYAQGYVLEVWGLFLMSSFMLFATAHRMFRRSHKVIIDAL